MPGLTINRPVPAQDVGSSGKYLKSDGQNATWEDVTASTFTSRSNVTSLRAWATPYQNTSGKAMIVEFNFLLISFDNAKTVSILTDVNNPPTTTIYVLNAQPYAKLSASLMVLPGHWYQFTTNAGAGASIISIFEVT